MSDTIGKEEYGLVNIILTNKNVFTQTVQWNTDDIPKISSVKILGVDSAQEVTVDGKAVSFTLNENKVTFSNKAIICFFSNMFSSSRF